MLHRLRFIPGRILQAIPVAFGVTILVFLMSHLLPGNPAVAILGSHATPASVAALSKPPRARQAPVGAVLAVPGPPPPG